MPNKRKRAPETDVAQMNYNAGLGIVGSHPLFAPLYYRAWILPDREHRYCPPNGRAVVDSHGSIYCNTLQRIAPEEWSFVIAHCLLHLGFGHFEGERKDLAWNLACDCAVNSFLLGIKFGKPGRLGLPAEFEGQNEERLYRRLTEDGIPASLEDCGMAGPHGRDMVFLAPEPVAQRAQQITWGATLAAGLQNAVLGAVDVAAGVSSALTSPRQLSTHAQRARAWFISSYPLLGALAAAFRLIEDEKLCLAMDIKVAAVDETLREIYLNPTIGMDEMECRFVLAHEMLHAGLRHGSRRQGRDPFLWNVACDYVINQWLVEMGVGALPRFGVLYDVELKGLSAEAVYDRIVGDLRALRKLTTFRGMGMGDIIDGRTPEWWANGDGVALDEFYRRALGQGLNYHQANGRGFIPAGLVEEIAALAQPPIPWDVELARWFDHYFPPLEKKRTYFRPSRRQGATPDIPRPRYVTMDKLMDARTFGVVLDTSGSMDRAVLARALGAIASYALARDVPAARVIFCDAAAYDAGYMPPEAIAERVRVRGRGGTILQPGIDLLQAAEDFPPTAPILIITDGLCDRVQLRREHAFLMPPGASLPFGPMGPVFRMGVGE